MLRMFRRRKSEDITGNSTDSEPQTDAPTNNSKVETQSASQADGRVPPPPPPRPSTPTPSSMPHTATTSVRTPPPPPATLTQPEPVNSETPDQESASQPVTKLKPIGRALPFVKPANNPPPVPPAMPPAPEKTGPGNGGKIPKVPPHDGMRVAGAYYGDSATTADINESVQPTSTPTPNSRLPPLQESPVLTSPVETAPAPATVETETKPEETPEGTPVSRDERFKKWFKMVNMGVPKQAVKNKMSAEGLDPDILDMDPNTACLPSDTPKASENAPLVLLKNDPDYGPFFKMLAVGVPRPAVEIKMEIKKLDPAMLDLGPDAPNPNPSSSEGVSSEVNAKDILGKPKGSLGGGGAGAAMLAALNKRGGTSTVDTPASQPARTPKIPTKQPPKVDVKIPPRFRNRRPSVVEASQDISGADLRGLFWKPTAPAEVGNTIWAELPDGSPVPLAGHLTLLQHKFTKAKAAEMKKRLSADKGKGADSDTNTSNNANPAAHNCSLMNFKIDGKRQQNLGIALARLKVPLRDVRAAIVSMDSKVLTVDLVTKLQGLVPSAEEMEEAQSTLVLEKECGCKQHRQSIFDSPDVPLGRPEQFVLTMASVPRISQRLQCLCVAAQLQGQSMALTKDMQLFMRGCAQFERSARLRKLLHLVLCCGNLINEGNPQRQGAWGFELTSGLPKLVQCKATSDTKYTLVHWLSEVVATQAPELLDVTDELNHVEDCLSIDIVALRTQARAISNNVSLVKREVEMVSKSQEINKSSEGDTAFLKFAKLFLHEIGDPNADCTAAEFGELEKRTEEILIKFGENPKTCTVQRLFICVLGFCNSLKQAHTDTVKARLAEEAKANPPVTPRSSPGSPRFLSPRIGVVDSSPQTSKPISSIGSPLSPRKNGGRALPPPPPPRNAQGASKYEVEGPNKVVPPKKGGMFGGLKALGGFAGKRNKLENKLKQGGMRNSLGRGQSELVTSMLARQTKQKQEDDDGGRMSEEQKNF